MKKAPTFALREPNAVREIHALRRRKVAGTVLSGL